MSKVVDAVSAFELGFHCSQAIVRTCGPDYGLSALDAVRVSCGFGGGMPRGGTCGAVSRALMILGLRFGPKDASGTSAKPGVYSKVDEFQSQFESCCNSVNCRDLLGYDISTAEGMEQATSKNLFKTVCPDLVQAAAEILEDMC